MWRTKVNWRAYPAFKDKFVFHDKHLIEFPWLSPPWTLSLIKFSHFRHIQWSNTENGLKIRVTLIPGRHKIHCQSCYKTGNFISVNTKLCIPNRRKERTKSRVCLHNICSMYIWAHFIEWNKHWFAMLVESVLCINSLFLEYSWHVRVWRERKKTG